MSHVYYLRRVEPYTFHPEFHLCSVTAGGTLWQNSDRNEPDLPSGLDEPALECPAYHSVAEVREWVESGEYVVSDEYGEVWGEKGSLLLLDELEAGKRESPELCSRPDRKGNHFVSEEFL